MFPWMPPAEQVVSAQKGRDTILFFLSQIAVWAIRENVALNSKVLSKGSVPSESEDHIW